MQRENEITAKMTRYQIEAVLALKRHYYVHDAADYLRISYNCLYNDLLGVQENTGLNPFKPDELQTLYDAIMKQMKGVIGGGLQKHFGTE